MKEYVYFLNAGDAFLEKNAYSEQVSIGFIVTYIIKESAADSTNSYYD
jgi:hypothetical protein